MFIKPFLSAKDKRVISVVVPLQVLANIASAIGSEAAIGSTDRSFWVNYLFLDIASMNNRYTILLIELYIHIYICVCVCVCV